MIFLKPCSTFILFILLFVQCSFGQVSNKEFYIYEDSLKQHTAEKALQLFRNGEFQRCVKNEINMGFTRSVYWLAYENQADRQPDSLLLFIGHPHINRIHFFFANDSTLQQQWITGDYFPFSQRPVKATEFYFPVDKKGIYLARVDKSNESLQLSFTLISRTDALAAESKNKIIMALFTGMILLLLIFGIYLFAITKDKLYIYYILYTASGWLWVLSNAGYGFEYIWPNLPWFASKARPTFVLTSVILAALFLVNYIGVLTNKKIKSTTNILQAALLFCVVIILSVNEHGYQSKWWMYVQYFISLFALVFFILILIILITASMRGNKMALFYLSAILTLFILGIMGVFLSFGSLPGLSNFFSHFGLSVGYIMEAIILTAGLVYRFNQYRVDKEGLLIQMNRQQQENTQVMMEVQEAERSQVATQLHDVAGSLLSAAKLNLSLLREDGEGISKQSSIYAEKAEEAVTMVSDMVRTLSHALSPVMMENVGFRSSLEKVIHIFNAPGKINIKLLIIGFEKYNAELHNYYTALYSITYELLNNIIKHSGAKNALLQVSEHEDSFTLIAEDDGEGVSLSKLNEEKKTLGIAGIQSKINYFGGLVAFDKNKPKGLIVTIEIPINRD